MKKNLTFKEEVEPALHNTSKLNGIRFYYILVGLISAWLGLGIQFYFSVFVIPITTGENLLVAVIRYFSYFTILANLLSALVFTAQFRFPGSRLLSVRWSSAVCVYIIITALVYNLILRSLWHPQGLQLFGDILLHDVTPALYTFYWFSFVPKGKLIWRDGFLWLIFPLFYFFYILVRGWIMNVYPYPFFNVDKIGYPQVLINALALLVMFTIFGWILILVDKKIQPDRSRSIPN